MLQETNVLAQKYQNEQTIRHVQWLKTNFRDGLNQSLILLSDEGNCFTANVRNWASQKTCETIREAICEAKKVQIELRWVLSGEKESAIGEKARKENYYKKSKKVNPNRVRTYDLALPGTTLFRWAKWPNHALRREKVEYITVSVESFFKYGTRSQQK